MQYKVSIYAGGHKIACPVCKDTELFEIEEGTRYRGEYGCVSCGNVLTFTRPLKGVKRASTGDDDED